jgi:hypothetical protein
VDAISAQCVRGSGLTVRLTDGDLSLTITAFDSRLDLRGLSFHRFERTPVPGPAARTASLASPHLGGPCARVVRLTGTLPQWRMEVPRARLEDVITQLSAVGRPLNLIWPTRG